MSAHDGPHLEICDGLQTIFGDDAAGLSTHYEGSNDAPTLKTFSPTDRVGAIPDGWPYQHGPGLSYEFRPVCSIYESGKGWNW